MSTAAAQTPPAQPTVSYSEVAVADVAKYFIAGFKLPPGEQLSASDWFYDAHKGVFVFKLSTAPA
ncbi:MAG: hypothetical protein K2Y24_00870 [Pseudomonadaceae bacterium]|nr:hypothetical protein [Pseudomonadaceae bacterium]